MGKFHGKVHLGGLGRGERMCYQGESECFWPLDRGELQGETLGLLRVGEANQAEKPRKTFLSYVFSQFLTHITCGACTEAHPPTPSAVGGSGGVVNHCSHFLWSWVWIRIWLLT